MGVQKTGYTHNLERNRQFFEGKVVGNEHGGLVVIPEHLVGKQCWPDRQTNKLLKTK